MLAAVRTVAARGRQKGRSYSGLPSPAQPSEFPLISVHVITGHVTNSLSFAATVWSAGTSSVHTANSSRGRTSTFYAALRLNNFR